MLTRFVAASLTAAALLAAPLGAQIVNGGFETPVTGNASYTGYSTGSTLIDGWTVTGSPGGNVAIISGNFTQNGYSFPAHTGAQWLDLTGTSNSDAGVQQTLATNVGQSYDITYWVGNTSGNIFGSTSTVLVTMNGTQIGTATNSTPGTTQFWQQFTTSFVATGTSTTIGFVNGDPNSDTENGLDDVTVNASGVPPVTTTPEPGSMALLGTGFVGLVPILRKRARRA